MKAYAAAILPTFVACSRCCDRARSKVNCMASQVSGVEPSAFGQAVGHFNRDGCLFVDQIGKSLTSDPEPPCAFRYRQTEWLQAVFTHDGSYRLTHGHQRLDLISDLASHYSGRPFRERVAEIQNRDRHTLGDALVVLNPACDLLTVLGSLGGNFSKNDVI